LSESPDELKEAASRFLFAMIDPGDRPRVRSILGGARSRR
jgi:hypothetical protein